MRKLLFTIFLIPAICSAQVPAGFKNVFDSITFIADPAVGNNSKQVTGLTKSLPVTFAIPSGWFNIGLYTAKNAEPFEKYCQFSGFLTDSVDTSKNPVLNITIVPSSYLLVIEKKDMVGLLFQKIPLIRIYEAGQQTFQSWLITQGEYYYCYLRRTKIDQVFRVDWDGSGDVNKMTEVVPIAGKSLTLRPVTQQVTLNIVDPFR